MNYNRIVLILIIVFAPPIQAQPLPEYLTGTCSCTVHISNQEVFYTNDCTRLFRPSIEVLVMPMHPGTGIPRVKTDCICTCQLDLRSSWSILLKIDQNYKSNLRNKFTNPDVVGYLVWHLLIEFYPLCFRRKNGLMNFPNWSLVATHIAVHFMSQGQTQFWLLNDYFLCLLTIFFNLTSKDWDKVN